MRNRFIQLLCAWAKEDESIYLLTADLGFSVLEPFAHAFPKRFINVGIAEQNMIGIAAGLSLMGKKVFVYIKKYPGPSYLRLSKGGEPLIHADYFDIEGSFKSELFSDINIICHGTVLSEVIKTKFLLKENYNLTVGVFSIPLLKPFPTSNCLNLLRNSKHIFLIEEHMKCGGMNSLVTSLAASLGPDCPYIYTYALDEKVMHRVGDQTYLRSAFGLNAENLLESILSDLSIAAKLEV